MQKVKQIVCGHDFESMSLHAEKDVLVKKCQRCGKRVEEDLAVA